MDRYLTVRETVAMYAGFYPRPRPVDEVIELVDLEAKRDTRVLKLSGGQQRRLDVAIALAGTPDCCFLDEPTTGFDPSARHEAWDVIKNLTALGKTVLLTSTHYMDEAQAPSRSGRGNEQRPHRGGRAAGRTRNAKARAQSATGCPATSRRLPTSARHPDRID